MNMRLFIRVLFGLTLLVSCGQNDTPKLDSSGKTSVNPVDSINQLIKQSPNNPDLYFDRAKLHYYDRDIAASLSDVGRALKLDSSNADYYLLLANLKLVSKQSRESKEALIKAYEVDPTNIEVLLKLGELYMVVEDYKTSFQYLNEALQQDIHNATAYRLKGFNYKYAGDTVNAVSSFQTAVEQNPDDYDSYMQLGLLYSIPRDPLALDYYNNALRVKPTSLEALYAKALHLQNTGDFRTAIQLYEQIAELNTNYFNAYYNKGFIYLEHLSKYDSASMAFTQAIQFGPKRYFQAVYNRGLAQERAGNAEKAANDYKLALEQNPQFDLAAQGLSRVTE